MDQKGYPFAGKLRKKGDTAYYNYDLGDHWMHRIVLENVASEESLVTLVDREGACAPEDSNGIDSKGCFSYAEFLNSYKKIRRRSKLRRK